MSFLTVSNSKRDFIFIEPSDFFLIKTGNVESAFTPRFIKEIIMEKSQDSFNLLTASVTKEATSDGK